MFSERRGNSQNGNVPQRETRFQRKIETKHVSFRDRENVSVFERKKCVNFLESQLGNLTIKNHPQSICRKMSKSHPGNQVRNTSWQNWTQKVDICIFPAIKFNIFLISVKVLIFWVLKHGHCLLLLTIVMSQIQYQLIAFERLFCSKYANRKKNYSMK